MKRYAIVENHGRGLHWAVTMTDDLGTFAVGGYATRIEAVQAALLFAEADAQADGPCCAS